MKRLLGILLLLHLSVAASALTLNGDLRFLTSATFEDGSYLNNELSLILKSKQSLGFGSVNFSLETKYNSVDKDSVQFYLREVEYQHAFEFDDSVISAFEFKVGLLKFTWGKSDELRVLDILNPQYLNYSYFWGIEDRKLGRLAASAAVVLGETARLELVFMPGLQKSILDNVALMPKGMQDLYTMAAAGTNVAAGTSFSVTSSDAGYDSLEDASFAARFRDNKLGFDYDLYFYSGNFNQPAFSWQSLSLVEEIYPRVQMVGMDIERPLGGFVVRAEAAMFYEGRMFSTSNPSVNNGLAEKPYLQAVVGVDKRNFIITGLYVNLQYGYNKIFDYSSPILQAEDEHLITLNAEWASVRQDVKISANLIRFFDRGWQLNPELDLKVGSAANLILGAYIISAEADDYLLGNYDGLNFGYCQMNVVF